MNPAPATLSHLTNTQTSGKVRVYNPDENPNTLYAYELEENLITQTFVLSCIHTEFHKKKLYFPTLVCLPADIVSAPDTDHYRGSSN